MMDLFIPFEQQQAKEPHDFKDWQITSVDVEEDQVEMISQQELEIIKKKAYDEAYQQGLAQAANEIETKQNQLSEVADLIAQPLKLINSQVQMEIIDLVIWLCQTCLHSELSYDPKKIIPIFKEIESLLPVATHKPELFLSPDDARLVRIVLDNIESKLTTEHVIDDPDLKRGEYRLSTETVEVDGKLATRLRQLVYSALEEGMVHHNE